VDGYAGLVFAPGGQPRMLVDFVLENGRIVEITMIADPERVAATDVEF
jgi:RNA polymerase sigma-70 factor (ECF subfamily)